MAVSIISVALAITAFILPGIRTDGSKVVWLWSKWHIVASLQLLFVLWDICKRIGARGR
jgi:hypothetical protein